ncbi:DUF998 domain-containing protein [Cryobacterium arcticum]|uniref:DUF998 domain-containing protein n=1 Tax=Cryobacterium arcticum TaxID=670052 RepID=A0A1B1BKS3_9MICO|nr:DUF998 domain-containing protein [Cryobacterium arcticum]ANP73200.1 hypothetical protein PA27867_2248 [Cryobacterium arcticum]
MRNPEALQTRNASADGASDGASDGAPRASRSTRVLATIALVGAVLYVLVDIVLQALPPHYSVVSEAESNLAVGPYGWVMNLNFLARGVVTVCAVAALAHYGPRTRVRRTGLVLMLIAGACSAALAFLPTDIPAKDAPSLEPTTALGTAHLVVAAGGFLVALVAFGLLTVWLRRSDDLRGAYPAAAVFTGVAAFGLLALGIAAVWAPGVIGLAERVSLVGVLGWVIAVSLVVRRRCS